jgi:hypothetical protein
MDYSAAIEQMISFWDKYLEIILADKPDIIVLPEACDRYWDFTGAAKEEYYEARGDRITNHFANITEQHKCYIAYSSYRKAPDGDWRNATELFDRNGCSMGMYFKNFPTLGEVNNGKVVPGAETPVFECDFGRLGCFICFDVNFTELCQQYQQLNPDLMLYSSAGHERLMEDFWAYQCGCHMVTSMSDPPARIISPLAETLATTTAATHAITKRINLDCALVFRLNNEVFKDVKKAYGSRVSICETGRSGSVLLSAEADGLTINEVIDEFGLTRTHQYFEETRQTYAAGREKDA